MTTFSRVLFRVNSFTKAPKSFWKNSENLNSVCPLYVNKGRGDLPMDPSSLTSNKIISVVAMDRIYPPKPDLYDYHVCNSARVAARIPRPIGQWGSPSLQRGR